VQKKPTPIKPNFANFPAELKLLPNWVLWRYMPPKSRSSKWGKVPFQTNGNPASTTDRSTWSTFEKCCAAYDRGGFAGLGFVFDGEIGADGLCYCGVDFDACVHSDKKIDSLAGERINRLDTYTELSVSGTGFHCIVRAEPLDRMVKFDGVEIYTNARYFTFTGRATGHIKAAPTEVRALVAEVRAKEAAAKQQPWGSSPLSSPELTSVFAGGKMAQAFAVLDPRESLADGIRNTGWYQTLSPEQKDEVVDYALEAIAKNTRSHSTRETGGLAMWGVGSAFLARG
jgi:primase-polymerase (primpol)-like protein